MTKLLLTNIWKITLFFMMIAMFFFAVDILTRPKTTAIAIVNGTADLTQADLKNNIAAIQSTVGWTFYPNKLYTPSDIVKGEPSEFHNDVQYGTFKILIQLSPGKIYGLSMRSSNFSQRTFINGNEQDAIGIVGSSRETTTPKTTFTTFYFVPQTEQTEIIVQYANFYHKSSGLNGDVYISEYKNINWHNQSIVFNTCIIVGCMVTIFIFYIGMYLFFGRKKNFLFFALCCLAVGVRALIVDDKVIMTLLPNLNWFVSIAMEYLSIIIGSVAFVAFSNSMFPGLTHRVFRGGIYIIALVYTGIILFTPTLFYSKLLLYYQLAVAASSVYILVRLMLYTEKHRLENILTLVGLSVFFLGALHDIFYYAFNWKIFGIHYSVGFTQMTMMIFVFANMIAVAMQFSRIENELNETLQRERALSEENLLLDRLSKMRAEFMASISHEMKMPLTVMSGYAQLTSAMLDRGLNNDNMRGNLNRISDEAEGLAKLVGQLLHVTRIQENRTKLHPVDFGKIASNEVDTVKEMFVLNGNRLTLIISPNLPHVIGDEIMLRQVLSNLLANANTHTKDGEITIVATFDKIAQITVTDTGEGISMEFLPHIFERYNTKSENGTGLGLAICKEIIEFHGGEITVDSELGKGTSVRFTLTLAIGGDTDE